MKTNFTHSNLFTALLFLAGFLVSTKSMAQPDFNFKNPTLISGTDKQVGAVYLFSNVKSGVDARVTFSYISPGSTVREVDGSSGFNGALQPGLTVNPYTTAYLEMYIEFVHAGTNTRFTQAEVNLTCLDVDGSGRPTGTGTRVNEFNEVNLNGGRVDYLINGTELSIVKSGNWFRAQNIGGIEYTERDTSAKQVMFTVTNANISSCTIRVGVDNQKSTTEKRQASVYFKRFNYSSFVLASSPLLSFRGIEKGDNVELMWKVDQSNSLKKITVERATTALKFVEIGEVKIDAAKAAQASYTFVDYTPDGSTRLYRLKIVGADDGVQYSNILVFRSVNESGNSFDIFPGIVHNVATMQVKTEQADKAVLQLVDYSGRIILQKNLLLQEGTNSISLNDLGRLTKGAYVALLKVNNKVYNKRLIKQ